MNRYKKILLVRTDRIGDVVLTTPVIKVLRENFPGAHIAFMARPYTKDIIEGNPCVDEVIVYDKYGKDKSIISTIRFARKLKKKKFDISLILHPTNRVHIISYLAQIPKRIGYNKKLGFLLTDKIQDLKKEGKKHEAEYNFDILKQIGINQTSKELYMPVRKEDKEYINNLLSKNGIKKSDNIVAINPTASCPSKIWPAERFKEVCSKLVKEYNVKIGIISLKDQQRTVEKITSFLNKEDYIVLSNLELKQLAAFLKKCRLFISNDSGPVHIAVAVKTPVISIFGRSQSGLSPARWKPLGEKDTFLHKEVGCKTCLAHNCNKDFKCLKAITVKDVLNAVERYKENINS